MCTRSSHVEEAHTGFEPAGHVASTTSPAMVPRPDVEVAQKGFVLPRLEAFAFAPAVMPRAAPGRIAFPAIVVRIRGTRPLGVG